jgi:nucleotide-binding universal stress UspA family protein
MSEHILIATDGSDLANRGLDKGLTLARALGAKVTVITVTEGYPMPLDMHGMGAAISPESIAMYRDARKAHADKILTDARDRAAAAGVEVTALHLPDANAAEAILAAARDQGATMVVMASHGRRGLGRLLLGSQTAEVLAGATVPVLVVR